MRAMVVRGLRAWDAVAVENPAYPGTPDVNYLLGWIELKWMRSWPKNASKNPVLIPHFTAQQRVWLKRRWNRYGNSHVLLKAGKDWLLFRGHIAADKLGRATKSELLECSRYSWTNGRRINFGELQQCLYLDALATWATWTGSLPVKPCFSTDDAATKLSSKPRSD